MKRLTVKVILMLIASMLSMLLIGWLLVSFISGWKRGPIISDNIYLVNIFSGIAGFSMFMFLLNKVIIKRIKELNKVVKEVSDGNYDIEINDIGVDELSILTNEFNEMTKELKANEYLSRDFVRNVSHEIKTPISSIKGYADLINNNDLSLLEIKEYSKIISDESARLFDLSRQMLHISLLDSSNKIKMDDIFSVDVQIRNIILLMQNEWQQKNLELDVDMEEVEFVGNEEMTHLIWQNLISNAVKYTESYGKINIRLYKRDKLYFEIEDTGKGIAKKDKPHIFEQFYTADSSKNSKSTGLGLPIVKKVVEKLNGNIYFESDEKKGSTFFVELKIVE